MTPQKLVSHHKDNNSELYPFHKSLQGWLCLETDHGNGVLNPISEGPMTPGSRFPRGHWPPWNHFSRVIDPMEFRLSANTNTNATRL
jgi:hypothetical protein